jgi:hypothetical protein
MAHRFFSLRQLLTFTFPLKAIETQAQPSVKERTNSMSRPSRRQTNGARMILSTTDRRAAVAQVLRMLQLYRNRQT